MPFASVPIESKKNINKAGHILIDDNSNPEDVEWALELADQWRACHAYPINTFQAALRRKFTLSKYDGEPIVAQRLKRMPTIIDKLKRHPNMQLSTMQDIGGVRAILNSIDDVYRLADSYKNKSSKSRFAHELVNENDYIQQPRSEDGYRSLHLIYRYKNVQYPDYDGLRLELQMRTKLQHTWATAVETMGTFLGQSLKSRQGSREWIDFFAITSSAFAHLEKCPPIPRYDSLSYKETANVVSTANENLGALEIMKGLSSAVDFISQGKGWSYHLLILNSLEKTVQVKSYDRESIVEAVSDLTKAEKEATEGKKIEPVLVSAGPISILRRAYPNFFLDIEEFVRVVSEIVSFAKDG
jgi:ppGpp synthetase/RelA/SpoT-type nucleotidyltranferase